MATIRDVANLSGVSTATVSNVLNARQDRVGAETRQKVLAAVRELKYRPTALEKNQKAILSHTLGVMVSDLTKDPLNKHGYFRDTYNGILEAALFRGWSVTVFAEKMWDDLGLAIRKSYDGRCDGLLMIAPLRDSESVCMLQERGVPLVLVGTTAASSGVSSVDVDNEAIGVAAAEHLLSLGHRRFAFAGHNPLMSSAHERELGFRRTLIAAGIPAKGYQAYWLREMAVTVPDFAQAVHDHGDARATGWLAWHDGMAQPLIESLLSLGLRVPQDISVVGVDDSFEARECQVPITSFPQNLHAIGKRAANLLIDRLGEDGEHPDEIVRFSSSMVQRASTGPAPTISHPVPNANGGIFPCKEKHSLLSSS
ncbi:LacI family transcriptional regulator [bacterium]|nr:MAG: LacI family transcriptional regulator [bacterium]